MIFIKRIFGVFLAFIMLFTCSMFVSAVNYNVESTNPNFAEGINNSGIVTPFASGLIARNSIEFSRNGKILTISGVTTANDVMSELGFKSLKVERSSDGSKWTTEATLGDFLNYDVKNYALYTTYTVTGGYYYRVSCTHYAKEQGWLFPGSQSISNYTSYIYIT